MWISIRNEWPTCPGTYKVLDSRKDIQTKAVFDGHEFATTDISYKLKSEPQAAVIAFRVTHWKGIPSKDLHLPKNFEGLQVRDN